MRRFLHIYFLMCFIIVVMVIADYLIGDGNLLWRLFFVGYGDGTGEYPLLGMSLHFSGLVVTLASFILVLIVIKKGISRTLRHFDK